MSNDNEWNRISELLRLLQPFEEATRNLSGSLYPSSSIAHPTIQALLQCLRSFQTSTNSGTLKVVAEEICRDLSLRWYLPNNVELLVTILDPRVKLLNFWPQTTIARALE